MDTAFCGMNIVGWVAFVEIDGEVDTIEVGVDRKADLEQLVAFFGGCVFPLTDVVIR